MLHPSSSFNIRASFRCIRRGMADEMDQKKWNNRIVVAVVSCIGAVLGSATLNLILGYYQ